MANAIRYRGVIREVSPETAARLRKLARQKRTTVDKLVISLLSKTKKVGDGIFLACGC